MTEDKAKALTDPVYKDSKVNKRLGALISYLGGGTPKTTSSTSSFATCPHPLIHALKQLMLPLAKQPLLHRKHMWTIQWDG